ncbi:MAG: alpha/beta hydrolase-fold protein [Bacteroidota bacterium]|nr:alpha/beta hydrolase-fold protein [Bacteroidota bacterium]
MNNLAYLVQEPKIKKDKNPLLLLIHGYGSNEEDLFSFASELPEDYYVVSVRAPHQLQPYGYAWYAITITEDMNKFSDDNQAIASREMLNNLVDELIQKYAIDPNDINLLGFSQGCILSYALALSYPERYKKVVALSGYLNPKIIQSGVEEKDFSNLKFFISHGVSDQIVPFEWGKNATLFLDKLGIQNQFHSYPVGHTINMNIFFDFKNFILNQ